MVALDSLKRVIAISLDTLINSQHEELTPVLILFVKLIEDVTEHSGVLASTSPDGDALARFEKFIFYDGLMDFGLEADEETLLADGLLVLWTLYHGFDAAADLA